jgi:hypothetical protein
MILAAGSDMNRPLLFLLKNTMPAKKSLRP